MRVGLFITCLTDTYYPRVGAAVVAVLRHLGCEVRFPTEQTCCGQPAFNNGLLDEARPLVANLAGVFRDDEYVVSPSASCAAMIGEHGPELFSAGSEPRRLIDDLASRMFDFTSFLCNVLKADPAPWIDGLKLDNAAFHYSCHSRPFVSPETAVERIDRLLGGRVTPLERFDQCCGFGGMFAMEYPQISGAMVEDKVQCIEASGAKTIICDEAGCRMNIEGALHRKGMDVRVVHTAEVIAEALGLSLPEGT
ncbi:MAG: (Fe-S)-binding protein [Phycisphaerales bacterium]|nr:MAG: (Fe-S)-binding protein [Phycisphaerales bacterium]